jgi:hypothetical protein
LLQRTVVFAVVNALPWGIDCLGLWLVDELLGELDLDKAEDTFIIGPWLLFDGLVKGMP